MSNFVALAKIQYSVDGVITTIGVSTAPYFGSATGLLRETWYPILQPEIAFDVNAAFSFEGGRSSSNFGALTLYNGRDGVDDYLLDKFLTSQVRGLETEVRRGTTGQTWDEMEVWLVANNDIARWDGEELTIGLRSRNDGLSKPLANEVFASDTPNPRIVNQTVPLLLGDVFQLEPLIFDAFNQVWYTAKNISATRDVQEGGGSVTEWIPVQFGHQMTAGTVLPITVDAIGPAPSSATSINRVTWEFDAWTSGDPDGITIFETASEATISENVSGVQGDVVINQPAAGDTGFVAFTDPALFSPYGEATTNWTAASGEPEDAIVSDDANPALVETWSHEPIYVIGVDPAIPADSIVTGVELEVIAEGSNARFAQLSVVDANGYQISAFAGVTGSGDFLSRDIPSGKTTMTGGGVNFKTGTIEFNTTRVNAGIGVFISVAQQSPGTIATAKIHRVRIKLHYVSAVKTVKLESTTAVLTKDKRYRVRVTHETADIWARWGSVATSGDDITTPEDPFSAWFAEFLTSGLREFEFVADKSGFFAFEYYRSTAAGTATVNEITVNEITDGINTYAGLVPYMGTLVELADGAIDTTSINAHDTACGSPALGWFIGSNESMADMMDLFARDSLFGSWWDDYDGKIRSALLQIDLTGDPELSLESIEVDGVQRNPYIVPGTATVQDVRAESATERARAARNWRPLREGEVVEIGEGFSEQDRADAKEEYRVIRRANFTSLNPWPVS